MHTIHAINPRSRGKKLTNSELQENVQSAITKNWIPQFEQAICRLEPYRESLLSEPGVDMES